MLRTAFRKPLTHIILIAALGLVVYSNTFNVPFQWDEEFFITNNPIVKDLAYFIHPSKANVFEQYGALKSRYIGYLTFALNYRLHGLDVTGYHAVNVSVHLLNAILVYFLVSLTFRTPFMSKSPFKDSSHIALFTGLLFVAHPVQTEAVTYIFQRLASLAAMFYMLSLVLYIKWRLTSLTLNPSPTGRGQGVRVIFYLLSLLSAVLAMKTKENAFTLPVAIMLYELLFFEGNLKRRVIHLIPFVLTMLIIPLTLSGIDKPAGEIIGGIKSAMRGYETTDRMDYLFTEFRVVLTYMRLLIVPINQNAGYDYPLLKSFIDSRVFLSFMFHLSAFCLAVYLIFRSKKDAPGLRILGFGLLWFYLTLSVESSIIPIPMVINEYRIYIPSVGIIMAVTCSAAILPVWYTGKRLWKSSIVTAALIVAAFSYAAYARNIVWRSEISLWTDVVKKSPQLAHAYYNLGTIYSDKGMIDDAIQNYKYALKFYPEHAKAYNNLGKSYQSKGLFDMAIECYESSLKLDANNVVAHNNIGEAFRMKGFTDKAIEHFKTAITIHPAYAEAHLNLGLAFLEKKNKEEALKEFESALRINPNLSKARWNLYQYR